MMYGYDFGAGWMWFVGIMLLLMLVALTALIIILSVGLSSAGRSARTAPGSSGRAPGSSGPARQIAEERLARGEITPEEFRHLTRALDERG
jgi:putative membrane protein